MVVIFCLLLLIFGTISYENNAFDTIGVYNILNDDFDKHDAYTGYPERVENIANNIVASGSDIIGIFEVNDIDMLMKYLPKEYNYIYQKNDNSGIAIIYNTNSVTLKISDCITYEAQIDASNGYCYGYFIDNETKEEILFIATHIVYVEPTNNIVQYQQIEELISFINSKNYDNLYLVGDFNYDQSYNMQYDIFELLENNGILCESSSKPTFPPSNLHLDYICGDVDKVEVIEDNISSDHNLIYSKI